MFRQLRTLTELLTHLVTVLLTAPAEACPVSVRTRVVVVGSLKAAGVVLDLVESDGATEMELIVLPDGSFAVRWR